MCGRFTLAVDINTIAKTFGVAPSVEAAPRYNIAPTQEVVSIRFKRLLRSRRCLVPADGFYEWKKERSGKTPMYITLKDGGPFAFAGLWDLWRDPDGRQIRTCTLITTEPNAVVAPIHDRMPVILPPEARDLWLDNAIQDEHALLPLLSPYPAEAMTARAVSRLVNNPKSEGAELIA